MKHIHKSTGKQTSNTQLDAEIKYQPAGFHTRRGARGDFALPLQIG